MEKAFGNEEWVTPINIKDNINKIKNKDKEYLFGKMVTYIKEIIQMTREMDMVKCIGMMGVIIKGNGKMEYKMVMVRFMCQDKDLKEVYFKIMYL